MLGAVAVTTLELTQQILQLPAQQRVPEICVLACTSPDKDSGTMLLLDNVLCQHGARVFVWALRRRMCLEQAILRTIL